MNILVFCGSSIGKHVMYINECFQLGKWMAQNGHTLIYGGSANGTMGVLADTVLENGGKAIGIMPKCLVELERVHDGLTELHIAEGMAERKQQMRDMADIALALPGGPGTLEEISEAISWARIGQFNKPCVVYNFNHYYDALENMFQTMQKEGFLNEGFSLQVVHNVEELQTFIEQQ
ncbi:MAG: TIGR00730 family Rossman fold protein [Eubacteriales bacterium]|nr:TIGR00730 family Rossman fold protein [Eubacteriales bacterium]